MDLIDGWGICDHRWTFLKNEKCYVWMRGGFSEFATQEIFYCQNNPEHRLKIPSDVDIAERRKGLQDMLEEDRAERSMATD